VIVRVTAPMLQDIRTPDKSKIIRRREFRRADELSERRVRGRGEETGR